VDQLRFDGRVAVVTGAGRGLGRSYALLLAERGAAVVVNDLGSSMSGKGSDDTPASEVVGEITAAGGAAVADSNDVADPEGAQALIDSAVDRYGRIDILVNNAGIMRWAAFPDVDPADFARHLAVHTEGSFLTARAAWPHMVAAGHGRIVMTTSAGLFGLPANTAYAAAKGGVVGLTRSLNAASEGTGILVNAIAPAAWTRMAGPEPEGDTGMDPALVAPMVAYLSHETCDVGGEVYAAGAGRFARIFIGSTPGHLQEGAPPTLEDVAANWDAINDESGYVVPADLNDWSAGFMSHLTPDS
jgi:NAD(P)-dependent dehydrogenase (short-subunit alcohol dehydrogenase family)